MGNTEERERRTRSSAKKRAVRTALSTAKAISWSSFGAPDMQEARLDGRRAIDDYGAGGESGGDTCRSAYGPALDMRIADELDADDCSFEAELVYRRLAAGSSPGRPEAGARLALLLEAKGYRWDAWRAHLGAAESGVVSSLLRLAVVCAQRHLDDAASHFMAHAASRFSPKTFRRMLKHTHELAQRRASTRDIAALVTSAARKMPVDDAFAWGTLLYVLAGRADLTRLVYLVALQGGHSLAAVSLLDMTPRSYGQPASAAMLRETVGRSSILGDSCTETDISRQTEALREVSAGLANSMQGATVEDLLDEIRAGSRAADDSLERIMVTSHMFTLLQGLRGWGRWRSGDTAALYRVADLTCGDVREIDVVQMSDPAAFLRTVWDLSASRLAAVRARRGSAPPGAGDLGDPKVVAGRRKVVGAGTVRRLGKAFAGLSKDQARILTMRLSGLYHVESAKSMALPTEVTRELHRSANKSLRERQHGEQIPLELWVELERIFGRGVLDEDYVDEEWRAMDPIAK